MRLNFNTNGHCLISKQSGIKLSSQLTKIKHPQRAKSYDIVEIGHNFNPKEFNTKIITFRDKNGKILQRNITKKTPDEVIETKKNYKEYSAAYIEDPTDVFKDLKILGRKISSITKKNNKYFSKSEEIQTSPADKHIVTISKIDTFSTGFSGVETENQSIYEYQKGNKKGYSIQNYIRNNHSGIFKFGDFKTKFENMYNSSMNDKYDFLHIYPFKQFKRIAPYMIENPIHKPPFTTIKWYSKYSHPDDETISFGFFNGKVNLNSRTLITKEDIVRTTAHEKEHAYQKMQRSKPIDEHTEEIKKNISAYNNYVPANKNYEEYRSNYNEIKAREAGELALKEYNTSLDDLKDEFMYAPNYQFGEY